MRSISLLLPLSFVFKSVMVALPACLPKLPKLYLTSFQARYLAEGIGTFIFIMTISLAEINCGTAAIDGKTRLRNFAPLCAGITLSVLVFAFGYVSGGHFNPAVTLGVLLTRGIKIEIAIAYWIAQISGGLVGAIFGVLISGISHRLPAPQVYNNSTEYAVRAFIGEAIFSAALVTVVLHVTQSKQKDNHFYGFAIGMIVVAAGYSVGGVSGGAFNPAVATSLQLVKCLMGNCVPLMNLWLYWLAPAAGALGASVLFTMTHPVPLSKEREEQSQLEELRRKEGWY